MAFLDKEKIMLAANIEKNKELIDEKFKIFEREVNKIVVEGSLFEKVDDAKHPAKLAFHELIIVLELINIELINYSLHNTNDEKFNYENAKTNLSRFNDEVPDSYYHLTERFMNGKPLVEYTKDGKKKYGTFINFFNNNHIFNKNQQEIFKQFSEVFNLKIKFVEKLKKQQQLQEDEQNKWLDKFDEYGMLRSAAGKRRIRKLKSVKKYHKSKGLKGKSRRRRRNTRKDKIKKRK